LSLKFNRTTDRVARIAQLTNKSL